MKLATICLCLLVTAAMPRATCGYATTGFTGAGTPIPNMQPSLALTYMVRTDFSSYYNLGEVSLFAGATPFAGWTVADGRLLDIDSYPFLYDALGTTYGGDGSATFALPDLRGRAAFGTGAGFGRTNRTLGAKFGAEQVTLTTAQLPPHAHTMPQGAPTATAGGGQLVGNTQPGLALNYALRTTGVFPAGGAGPPYDGPLTGQIDLFAGNSLPSADAPADGRLLPKNQNTALFALLGTTFGGNGTTNFAVPDLRGSAALAAGPGPGLTNWPLGEMPGAETTTLTDFELPLHNHTLPASGQSTGFTGGAEPQSNMGPSLAVNYIIATSGHDPNSEPTADGTFLGQLRLFAGTFAPAGFAFADGQLLSPGDYPELFGVLGSSFGGDGVSTFALPDLRSRVAIGAGSGLGLTSRAIGDRPGTEAVTLTLANLPAHAHDLIAPLEDYNRNGIVDAADYTVWRNTLGSTTNLAADGNHNSTVDRADYNLWKTNFGHTTASGAGQADAAPIPEPATFWLLATAIVLTRPRRRPQSHAEVRSPATAH